MTLLRLLLAFTLVPLLELAVLLRLGGWLGLAPTLGLVLGTGMAGAWLARREGMRSWGAVRAELGAGRLPAEELLHALGILVAGVLLITPGVFTDIAGLLLLARPFRRLLIRRARDRLMERLVVTQISPTSWSVFEADLPDEPAGPADDGEARRGGRPGRVIEL